MLLGNIGKTATVINIEDSNAIVKLDKDGKAYQEVEVVKYNILAKADPERATKRYAKKPISKE